MVSPNFPYGVPEFPQGDAYEEATAMAREAIEGFVEALAGEPDLKVETASGSCSARP